MRGRGESTENLAPEKTPLRRGASSKAPASIVPLGRQYMEQHKNVLLISEHGVGKTESVMQLAKSLDYNLKIFNCATLDPYIDLIGVPFPEGEDDNKTLAMVKQKNLLDAEVLFFDELNRAQPATVNGVFEIIQFGTLNGEKLPNLKCCWAAMNPPGGEYQVQELDPALIDRFDGYVDLKPRPSVEYMSQYIDEKYAKVLVDWWREHNQKKRGPESYISPRRLMKIGLNYVSLGYSPRAVTQALPPGGKYDHQKLLDQLNHARHGTKPAPAQKTGQAPQNDSKFTDPKKLRAQKASVVRYLKKNKNDQETQKKILKALEKGIGGENLVKDYTPIFDAMQPALVEGWFQKFPVAKQSQMRAAIRSGSYVSRQLGNNAMRGRVEKLFS